MILAAVNKDPELREWRMVIVGMAVSALLHAAIWTAWHVRKQEPESAVTPPQVIEVSLVSAPPQSVPQPPRPAVKPPPPAPPKPEKPPEKPAPKMPAKPKPAPKKPPSPEPAAQAESAAPETPAPAVEAPPAPAPVKAAPTPPPFVEASYKSPSLHNPPTRYPPVAIERRWEGTVIMRVQVLPDGTAGEIRIEHSSGHEILDDATVDVVKTWHFMPARRGDQAVASWVTLPVEYKLKH